MDPSVKLTIDWLTIISNGDYDAWGRAVSADLVMRFPFLQSIPEQRGMANVQGSLKAFWPVFRRFKWLDVRCRLTEDPQWLITTARSEALTTWGEPYANEYVIFTRVVQGKIVEHIEYFDSLRAARLQEAAELHRVRNGR